jgi:hypothetical protein
MMLYDSLLMPSEQTEIITRQLASPRVIFHSGALFYFGGIFYIAMEDTEIMNITNGGKTDV